MVGVAGVHPDGSEHHVEVRVFAASGGFIEDPVTGSFNAALAQWMIGAGTAPSSYTASQGTRVGRRGVVRIDADEDGIWVGGVTTTPIRGRVEL